MQGTEYNPLRGKAQGRRAEGTRHTLPGPSGHACFSQRWRVAALTKRCQPGELPPASVAKLSLEGQSHRQAASAGLTSATHTPASPRAKQLFPISHIVRTDLCGHTSTAWLKASGSQKRSPGGVGLRLRGSIAEVSRGTIANRGLLTGPFSATVTNLTSFH